MSNIEVRSLSFRKEEVSELLLPKLLGRVFHFTTSSGWAQIQSCGYIETNETGKYRGTSIHSHESMGRHLGAVCLFDLSKCSQEDLLRKDWILYDYFERRWKREPSFFLFLGENHFPALTTLDQIELCLKKEKMYIPKIESWHIGNLPLSHLEMIYQVQIN